MEGTHVTHTMIDGAKTDNISSVELLRVIPGIICSLNCGQAFS